MTPLLPVKVYVPVWVETELPPKECDCYFTMLKQPDEPIIMGSHLWNFNGKDGWDEDDEYVPPNYWLKPQSLYTFTREELEKVLGDAFMAGTDTDGGYNEMEGFSNQYIKSLLK